VGEGGHLENVGVDGRIILKWIFKKYNLGIYYIYLAQDKDKWRAVVKAVMNFWFHKMSGVSPLAKELLPFVEGLCSMERYNI
jgi:hypothetical protein